MVAMTYVARFDPKGRGTTKEQDEAEDESEFGFRTLTWGDRKADIDVNIRAKRSVNFIPTPTFFLLYTSCSSNPSFPQEQHLLKLLNCN